MVVSWAVETVDTKPERRRRTPAFNSVSCFCMGKNIAVIKQNAGHLSRLYSMIRKSPFFLRIMEQQISAGGLNPPISLRDFNKGSQLVVQGKTCRNVLVIRSGV